MASETCHLDRHCAGSEIKLDTGHGEKPYWFERKTIGTRVEALM